MINKKILTGLLLIVFNMTAVAASTSASKWTIEIADVSKYFEKFYPRSLAIDNFGHPHIAYGGNYLYYAYNDGSNWYYETIDSSPRVGYYASIALDSSGKAHISYLDRANLDLKYATNSSGSWVTTTVDSSGNVGSESSIAIDTLDKVHISYWDSYYEGLKYSTNASGLWETETVDSIGNAEYANHYTSIALDSSDMAHISYLDVSSMSLNYAYSTKSIPTATPVATVTPTPTSTPRLCTAVYIEASPSRLTLNKKERNGVTVTVTGSSGCSVKGDSIKSSINSTGKNIVSVSPNSTKTNEDGQAVFTITAKKKTGHATVTFKDGNLKTKVKVKVTNGKGVSY